MSNQGGPPPDPYAAPPGWGDPPGPRGGYPPQPYPPQPPYPPYGGYQGQPPPYHPHGYSRPTNGMAIASLVLGIVWIYWIGSILALVFGYTARRQIRERGESGDGMAVAGIVLGWVGVVVLAIVVIGLLFAAISDPGTGGSTI